MIVTRELTDGFGNYSACLEHEGRRYRVTRNRGKRVRLAYSGRTDWQHLGTVYLDNRVVWSGQVRGDAKARAIFGAYRRGQ